MAFIPFDASEPEIAELSVLRSDLSTGLQNELINWILNSTHSTGSWASAPIYAEIATALDLGWSIPRNLLSLDMAKTLLLGLSGRKLLHAVDYMLSKGYSESSVPAALVRARSAYAVRSAEGRTHRLTVTVPEALLAAVRGLTSRNDAAGRLLAQAWNKAFDLTPDDSAAYMHAVQAVEAAGLAALGIENPEATLGSVIRAIEKDPRWGLPFVREHTNASGNDTLLHMLRSLWRGHRDRHGSEAWEGVTHNETVAAVYLSLSLVGLFHSGLIQQRGDLEN